MVDEEAHQKAWRHRSPASSAGEPSQPGNKLGLGFTAGENGTHGVELSGGTKAIGGGGAEAGRNGGGHGRRWSRRPGRRHCRQKGNRGERESTGERER